MLNALVENAETAAPAKRGRGRPATLTLPIVQQVAQLIAKGMTEEQACVRVGVNHCTFRTARHRNPEFETVIKEAQAEYVDESLEVIGKGGRGWQGRAWILERRHADQFRRTSGLEVSGQIGAFSLADLLIRKPLEHWTSADVDNSVGAWKLLKQWPTDQLLRLNELYPRHWGPTDEWEDERLEWFLELGDELARREKGDRGELVECDSLPMAQDVCLSTPTLCPIG